MDQYLLPRVTHVTEASLDRSIREARKYFFGVDESFKGLVAMVEQLTDIPSPDTTGPYTYPYLASDFLYRGVKLKLGDASTSPSLGLAYLVRELTSEHSALKTKHKSLLGSIILFNRANFWDSAGHKDMQRDYAKTPAYMHQYEVAFTLPEDAPAWVLISALLHDTVEDSPEYKLLERWWQGESLSEEEMYLLRIDPKRNYKEEEKIQMMDSMTLDYIGNVLEGVGLDDTRYDLFNNVFYAISTLTRRPYEDYGHYIGRIGSGGQVSDTMRYWLIMIKMNDRLVNTRMNVPVQDSMSDSAYLQNYSGRWIKDLFKNITILERAREFFHQYEEETIPGFWRQFNALFDLGNRNANELLIRLQGSYQAKKYEGENPDFEGLNTYDECFAKIDQGLFRYFESGGFFRKTKSDMMPPDQRIMDFDGTIDFYELMTKRGISVPCCFSDLSDPDNVLKAYKYAAVLKVWNCLYVAHLPFDSENRLLVANDSTETLGRFVPELVKQYSMEGWGTN